MPIPQDPRSRLNISVNEVRRPVTNVEEIRKPEPFHFQSDPEPSRDMNEKKSDREIHFSIKPWKLIKFFIVLVLLSGLFFAGRWSVVGTEGMFSFSTKAPTAAVVVDKVVETPPAVQKTVEPAPQPAKNDTPATAAVTDTAKENKPGEIITKYSKVALATSGTKLDWQNTWGKITQIALTIKNNEIGTIKPSYLIMNVEGYDDFDKRIDLPSALQTVKAGEKVEATVNIPNGFAYNPITTGDLSSVHILVKMYDGKDTLITAYERDFNLDGAKQ